MIALVNSNHIALVNVSPREFKVVPQQSIMRNACRDLGYVDEEYIYMLLNLVLILIKTNDYKLARWSAFWNSKPRSEAVVYSLRSNSWKRTKTTYFAVSY